VNTNSHWYVDSDGQFSLKTSTGSAKVILSHKAGTTDAEGFLAYQNRMPTPDVAVQAIFSTDTAALFELGVRGKTASTADDDRQGTYLVGSRGETAKIGTTDCAAANMLYLVDRATNNSTTFLASASQTLDSQTAYVLRLDAKGTRYRGYVDGTAVLSAVSSTHTRPGYVRFGVGGDSAGARCYMYKMQVVENRNQAGFEAFCAQDEARKDILFHVKPTIQYVYDTEHSEWSKRDWSASSLANFVDALGEVRALVGTSDGYVVALDNATQFSAADFTGTWTSNWFDLGDDETRKRLTHLLVELVQKTSSTTARLRIERCEHPDLPSNQQEFPLYTGKAQNWLSPQFGGRFVRFTVIHAAAGELEIQQIKTEPQTARPANRPLVSS
jgi:hypothetical protein